ncbi:hypothetical protein [Streptomyces radicis]|nr:hypothetical protein [Streptomyces radicis]
MDEYVNGESDQRPYLAPGDTVRIKVRELGAIFARTTAPEAS